MRHKITAHVRRNVVGYIALLTTLGGTSYAAVGFTAGHAKAVVPHLMLVDHSVDGLGVAQGALVRSASNSGARDKGAGGSPSPAGADGSSSIAARARLRSSVVATHGDWTDIPLTGNTWTQAGDELELLAGTMVIKTPASCTGSLGNALMLSVDGKATTFASAPTAPASSSVTMPFLIGTLSEPGGDTQHELTAKFGVSCTKSGEDYAVDDVKVDVLKFR